MAEIPLEQLKIQTMVSGGLSVTLTCEISWHEFADYARGIAQILGATIGRRSDSASERAWELSLAGMDRECATIT
jgi:hypothetical protein